MSVDLEIMRARWSAAHQDDEQITTLDRATARALLVEAVADIHTLIREVERLQAGVDILTREPVAAIVRSLIGGSR